MGGGTGEQSFCSRVDVADQVGLVSDHGAVADRVAGKIDAAGQRHVPELEEDDDGVQVTCISKKDGDGAAAMAIVKAEQIRQVGSEIVGDAEPDSQLLDFVKDLLAEMSAHEQIGRERLMSRGGGLRNNEPRVWAGVGQQFRRDVGNGCRIVRVT